MYCSAAHALERAHRSAAQQCLEQIRHIMLGLEANKEPEFKDIWRAVEARV
jgi:hypothetical protein